MTEIQHYQPQTALTEQMDYARAVSDGSLLPDTYRGKPANVLIAVGLGSAMGLSPAESLYRIDVIQGKPTAAAELIASNVRKAGHKLRVKVTEDPPAAVCTIIRGDDPDEPTVITRDLDWAKRMGLTNKDNYKKQPATMLSWRAISACARLACPEALYGVAYTPDEMDDQRPSGPAAPTGGGLGAALAQQDAQQDNADEDIHDAEVVDEPEGITPAQLKKLHTVLNTVGLTERAEALAYYGRVTGRDVDSTKALTKWEAGQVIDDLERCERGETNLVDPASANDPSLDLGGDQ